MHVISRQKLRDYCQTHADFCDALDDWYKIASQANWTQLIEVPTIYPQAEAVGIFTIFNIKGNKYCLIVSLNYQKQIVYIKYILTHAEYDKENWKNDPYF